MDDEARLRQRYFRKIKAHPEGAVAHFGDCNFFAVQICTCGLLEDLRAAAWPMASEIFPEFRVQLAMHDAAMELLMRQQRAHQPKRKKTGR